MTQQILDALTGEIQIIELTDEEVAQREQAYAEYESGLKEKSAKAAEKAALLERLGITEDEAKLLLG
jgi:hypothetical protein